MWIVEPPERMRLTAESMGASGREWLAVLPARVEQVCRSWSLRPVAARLSAATGVDEQAVWEWGFVERVSSGLYMIRHGAPGEGRDYLAAAARLNAYR